MTARPGRRGSARRSPAPVPTAPGVTTPPLGGRYRPLAPAEVDGIVDHAFAILERIGMADAPPSATQRLLAVGAIEREDGRLLLPRPVVEAALGRAPATVDLPGFTPDRGCTIGGGNVHIGTGGAAVRVLDPETGGFRDSRLADLWSMMRVLDASPNIHYGLRPLIARDLEDPLELDLNTAYAVTGATSKPTGVSFTSAATVDPVVDLFDVALGSQGAFARRPFSMAVVVHVVPPLRFSPEGYEIMERAIERGMIIQTCSAGQAGATSPPSLAGSLAQGLAEILAGVVLADAIRPGHPCIHAFMPFISDLRSGAMTGGSGEAAVISAAAAQLLLALDLPHAVSAGITDAKIADAQAKLDAFLVKAPSAGAVETTLKKGDKVDADAVVATIAPGLLAVAIVVAAPAIRAVVEIFAAALIITAIPFGFVGAVIGHMFTGYDLSILSMFGVIALSGVVVNDNIVLVDWINKRRSDKASLMEAVRTAGAARFRPILLTSLTTFFGLLPLLLERSVQARFLVPMAVSLAFGVLFATLITLVLVPCLYLVLDDVVGSIRRTWRWLYGGDDAQAPAIPNPEQPESSH